MSLTSSSPGIFHMLSVSTSDRITNQDELSSKIFCGVRTRCTHTEVQDFSMIFWNQSGDRIRISKIYWSQSGGKVETTGDKVETKIESPRKKWWQSGYNSESCLYHGYRKKIFWIKWVLGMSPEDCDCRVDATRTRCSISVGADDFVSVIDLGRTAIVCNFCQTKRGKQGARISISIKCFDNDFWC